MDPESCFLCRKHSGLEEPPPGGYIYRDDRWMICHAPVDKGPLGTLFIESARHVLDFGDFNEAEATAYGVLTGKVYNALRRFLGVERIYQVSMMEGIPHFHAWIVPRMKEIPERGVVFLARDLACTTEEAAELAHKLWEEA